MMPASAPTLGTTYEPTTQDSAVASDALRALVHIDGTAPVQLQVKDDPTSSVTLLPRVFATLVRMLTYVANGNTVAVVPVLAELTTTQAAHLLNVSRPHIIKLIERGALPHKMVGTHRKLLARDVLVYKAQLNAAQGRGLDAMAALDQEAELDDGTPADRGEGVQHA